jgi:hypothetical protein
MTSTQQTWFVIVALVVPLALGYIQRLHREAEQHEQLEDCFRSDPRSAARYYSPRTSSENRLAIFEACIPEMPDLGDHHGEGR